MASLWRLYQRVLQTHPFKTQVISTGILCGAGDVLSQQIVEKKTLRGHDIRRTVKFSCIGFFYIGPALRTWYVILDRIVKGSATKHAIQKMALDQSIWAPSFLSSFLALTTLLDGKGIEGIKEKLRVQFIPVLITNWKIWPAVQLLNFYFIPLNHRVLVVNILCLFWNTYLSWVAYNQPESPWKEGEIVEIVPQ